MHFEKNKVLEAADRGLKAIGMRAMGSTYDAGCSPPQPTRPVPGVQCTLEGRQDKFEGTLDVLRRERRQGPSLSSIAVAVPF